MENTNSNIEVVDAFYVTKEAIKPVKAFKIMMATGYSGTKEGVWYLKEKGWTEAPVYGIYRDIAWTEDEAKELKRAKMEEHLKYLRQEQEKNKQTIADMEAELNSPQQEQK